MGKRKSISDFINDSNKVHKNKYDYSLVEYKNNKTKVKIICPEHGVFEQKPNGHLLGYGCPKCTISNGELSILNYLNNNKISFIHQKTFDDCKYKNKLRYDFYLPYYNICIEYDGEQHYKPIYYFGGKIEYEKLIIKDNIKNRYCENNNISLIRISYNDINNIEQILNNNLKQ